MKDDFDEWLARVVCFAFSIPPTAFVRQVNRATAETQQQAALSEGLAPLLAWVKGLIDRVIGCVLGWPDLEFVWTDGPPIDPAIRAQIDVAYVTAGIKTADEVRAGLGLGPLPKGAIAKAGYDAAEARDDAGKWTDGGGSASSPTVPTLPAGTVTGTAAANLIAGGALVGATAAATGEAGLAAAAAAGEVALTVAGAVTPVGWAVIGTLAVGGAAYAVWQHFKPAATPSSQDRPDVVTPPITTPQIASAAQVKSRDPEICPKPVPDTPHGESAFSAAYKAFINRVVNPLDPIGPGEAVRMVNPKTGEWVYYDDCDKQTGDLIDAKGLYAKLLNSKDYPRLGVLSDWQKQGDAQITASAGRHIIWYFAESDAAEEAAEFMRDEGYSNRIEVRHRQFETEQ